MENNNELKRFCAKCGSVLTVSEESAVGWSPVWMLGMGDGYDAYDKKTGKANIVIAFTCPKRRWYNGNHSRFGRRKNF